MDDIEHIIITTLKETGYITNDTYTNLRAYPYEDLLQMAIHCLRIIMPQANFPPSLPPIMSARYQMCSRFARICKELGYTEEVGYHTFMYKNHDGIRKVVIFLVENLPKKISFQESEDSEAGKNITLKQKISEKLKNIFATRDKNEPAGMCKAPFISVFLETGTLLPNQKIDCKPLEWKEFVVKKLPFINEQSPDYWHFLPSLITLNSDGLVHPTKPKCSKFSLSSLGSNYFDVVSMQSHQRRVEITGDWSSKDKEGELFRHINKLRMNDITKDNKNDSVDISTKSATESENDSTIIELEREIKQLSLHIKTLTSKMGEITKSNEALRLKLREKIKHESSLQKSIQLLPESENNIPQLEAANEKCRAKIKNIESQWNRHKELLLHKRTELQKFVKSKNDEKKSFLHQITEIRKELFDVVEQIEQRRVVEQRLEEYSGSVKGVKRNEYIQRIMDIIGNLKKQETHVDAVLKDLRYVQKEINTLTGKVDRSFALSEQLITNSPTDNFSIETHKLLVVLHKTVCDILNSVTETGNYMREIRDIEDQTTKQDNVKTALEDITKDLANLKEEQETLVNEIRKLEGLKELKEILGEPASSQKTTKLPFRPRLPYTVYSMLPKGKLQPVNVIDVFSSQPSTSKQDDDPSVTSTEPISSEQKNQKDVENDTDITSAQDIQKSVDDDTPGISKEDNLISVEEPKPSTSKQNNESTTEGKACSSANNVDEPLAVVNEELSS